MRVGRLLSLNFRRGSLVAEGPNQAISVAIFLHCDGDFGLDDGVDASDLICDLPGALEEQRVAHVTLNFGFRRHLGVISKLSSLVVGEVVRRKAGEVEV